MDIGGKMAIFNSLTFDGQNSLDNGVFITAESSYDAPERDIEEIEIAGRNGAFLLDKGRWKNIEVTYKAGAFGSNQTEFSSKIRDFRNLMASRIGYKRLTDTYNPNEFRLGTFKDAFEVKPESANRHGEFDLIFNCKPQRYLTGGETEITVSSGDTITNPTPYPCQPMIETYGYGELTVNGYQITIVNEEVGYIVLCGEERFQNGSPIPIPDLSLVDTDDSITIKNLSLTVGFNSVVEVASISFPSVPSGFTASSNILPDGRGGELYLSASTVTMTKEDVISHLFYVEFSLVNENTTSLECRVRLVFDGNKFVPKFSLSLVPTFEFSAREGVLSSMDCISTASKLGQPTYIDCEIGEVYKMHNGQIMSLNRFVDLGSDLPVLDVGSNEVTFDDTYSVVKIVPRWFIL